MLILQAL